LVGAAVELVSASVELVGASVALVGPAVGVALVDAGVEGPRLVQMLAVLACTSTAVLIDV
jgi:hypothetical protein